MENEIMHFDEMFIAILNEKKYPDQIKSGLLRFFEIEQKGISEKKVREQYVNVIEEMSK